MALAWYARTWFRHDEFKEGVISLIISAALITLGVRGWMRRPGVETTTIIPHERGFIWSRPTESVHIAYDQLCAATFTSHVLAFSRMTIANWVLQLDLGGRNIELHSLGPAPGFPTFQPDPFVTWARTVVARVSRTAS